MTPEKAALYLIDDLIDNSFKLIMAQVSNGKLTIILESGAFDDIVDKHDFETLMNESRWVKEIPSITVLFPEDIQPLHFNGQTIDEFLRNKPAYDLRNISRVSSWHFCDSLKKLCALGVPKKIRPVPILREHPRWMSIKRKIYEVITKGIPWEI